MTSSMPADSVRTDVIAREAAARKHRSAGRPSHRRLAILTRLSGAALRVLPVIPDRIKRVLLGGRRVTVDGNTLDTTLQLMLTAQRSSGVGGLVASSDVEVARNQLDKLAGHLDSGVVVRTEERAVPGPAGSIRVRHYLPEGSRQAPLLVFFHGGGFVIGDLDTHDGLCRLICRDAGIHVMSVDYRLAPERPAPAGLDDCYAVYLWCVKHATELGADPRRIAVGGDSAGGNFAAVIARQTRDNGDPAPVLQLLIYPVTDIDSDTRSKVLFADGYFLTKADMDWFRDSYLSGSTLPATDPRISPLLAEDLSGLPPALVVTAGFDPLRDEGNAYAEALAAAGVVVDHRTYGSVVHAFANFFPLGGDSAVATADMVSALRAHLSR